ncbi:hypothetical protein ABTZ57_29745 [Streptomyces sp. NPDC094048]|uniref:hypothetical protein n=1 Tax=unclassified Streptomyces TaxID=2593676 RepID=UPI003330AA85
MPRCQNGAWASGPTPSSRPRSRLCFHPRPSGASWSIRRASAWSECRGRSSHEEARLLAAGDAVLDVPPALRAAPYGAEDIAVTFAHMDFGNRAITEYFRYEDHRTMLVRFALARPQHRPLSADEHTDPGGPTHPVRTCVVHTFKHASEEGAVPALASVVSRHLGPDLISGSTWG